MLATVDNAIHHALCYDAGHFLVNHPPGHNGMMWVDASSGGWSELRRGDAKAKGDPCHQLPTARGIAYEVFGGGPCVISGLYDPFRRRRLEFRLPPCFGYTHTGWDPEGRIFFWETAGTPGHSLWRLTKLDAKTGGHFQRLSGDWPLVTGGQRGHFHPAVTPDRKWILMTGGDSEKQSQIFLLDISDLEDTQGIRANCSAPMARTT